jgi:hypothetical protein
MAENIQRHLSKHQAVEHLTEEYTRRREGEYTVRTRFPPISTGITMLLRLHT